MQLVQESDLGSCQGAAVDIVASHLIATDVASVVAVVMYDGSQGKRERTACGIIMFCHLIFTQFVLLLKMIH